MASHATLKPEFSRVVALDRFGDKPFVRQLVATPEECAALAARFGIESVGRLQGTLRVSQPASGPAIRVAGHLEADVIQTCVVSLALCGQSVAENFVQRYTTEVVAEPEEVFSEPDAEEPPETLEGDTLDLGEILAEQLALALDPYPRAPGATFEGASFGPWDAEDEAAAQAAKSPFAALDDLKDKD